MIPKNEECEQQTGRRPDLCKWCIIILLTIIGAQELVPMV